MATTKVRLHKNVNITKDNYLTFSSEVDRESYFSDVNKIFFEKSNTTYQRKGVGKGSVDIGKNFEEIVSECSYLSFQNNNKWYYAFIDEFEYINPNNTRVHFIIDDMTTYFFDVDIEYSHVERKHVSNDTIGQHTQDEGLDIGDLYTKNATDISELEDLIYIFVATEFFTTPDTVPSGAIYTGVYSGLWFFGTDDQSLLDDWIEYYNATGKIETLITIFTMPKALVDTSAGGLVLPSSSSKVITETINKAFTNLDGYTPKNNKLFTFPFYFMEVGNNQGQSNIYKYEDVDQNFMSFRITANIAPSPTVFLEPLNYRGQLLNGEEYVTLSDFPLSSWAGDAYQTWLAQNQVSNAVKIGGSILGLAGGIATQNPLAIGGGALGVASSIGSFKEQSIRPDTAKGTSSGGGNIARGKQTFTIYEKSLKYENANIIDDYFTRYGYKVNVTEKPVLQTRQNFNYWKMRDLVITGNVSHKTKENIKQLFLNGVTFWHSDNIGNYSLSNNPI